MPDPVVLADLTRVKSARACLPPAGAFRARPGRRGQISNPAVCGTSPLAPRLAPSGNETAETSTGRFPKRLRGAPPHPHFRHFKVTP